MRLHLITGFLAVLLTATVATAQERYGDLTIDEPWARATAPSQPTGAAYLTVTNAGETDRIIAAATPIAGRVELHTHAMDDAGVMRMREVEAIELPAGETTALEPGGLHVMLFELESNLVEGETFPLTLSLENGGEIELEVQVQPVTYGIGDPAGHGHGN
jgi:hypothetical protein